MKGKRVFESVSPQVLGAVGAGLSIVDAATQVGVSERTVKNWLTRGRREPESKYGPFAVAVDGARDGPGADAAMSRDELFVVVSRAARKGSVQAQKLYWEMLNGPGASEEVEVESDPLAGVDEVARRRERAAA